MSKKKAKSRPRDSERKPESKTQKKPRQALPAAPLPGSAQQEAPPPITGPASAMVIMAHPDDAEFLCAGTIAKWCAEGWNVTYVVVTGGDKGTHDRTMHPEKLAAIREEEQRAACRLLGVKECILLGYPDGFTVDEHELRGQIVRLLRQYRPDVVITWDAFRGTFNHRDHRNVGTLTADAIYPIVRDRLFYPADEEIGLESHQVNEVLLAGTSDPDYTVDVSDYWEKKIDAILCHASQVGGRTKEDFLKDRAAREEKEGVKPIEERFKRWSIRRPQRQPNADSPAAAIGDAPPSAASAAPSEAQPAVPVGAPGG